MADDDLNKTEQATPKRKDEARRQGQVAVSRDVGTAAVLLGGVTFVAATLPMGLHQLTDVTRQGLANSFEPAMWRALTVEHVSTVVMRTGTTVLSLILPVLGVVAVCGVTASLAQTGWMWRPNALSLDWSRLNPMKGLSRLFSFRSVMELIKGLVKIAIITGVALWTARKELVILPSLIDYDLSAAIPAAGQLVFKVTMGVIGALVALAGLDYLYQRYEWERGLRMTKQEVKEEHKAAEGDPLIRGRVRQAQRELAKKRMLTAVKTADVVVTNPTHLAVALKYDGSKMAAPFVVAKGAGFLAERIREIARHNGVPVIENKFVARSLYRLVDIGKEIPANLYRAVAEILAYVYRAKGVTPDQM